MANWEELKDKIRSANDGSPQRIYHALEGLEMVRAGLAELAKYGHRFDLIETDASPPIEWPKMLYNGAKTIIVESAEEAEKLGPEWSHKPPGWTEPEVAKEEPEATAKVVSVDIASIAKA